MKRILIPLVASWCLQAMAAPPVAPAGVSPPPAVDAARCEAHSRAIDFSERQIAFEEAQSVGDNSAARETNRLLRRILQQQQQQMHIVSMAAERCPSIPMPRDGVDYVMAGLDCTTAQMKGPSDDAKAKCLMANWKPNSTYQNSK
jgi:hypothetical protein